MFLASTGEHIEAMKRIMSRGRSMLKRAREKKQ